MEGDHSVGMASWGCFLINLLMIAVRSKPCVFTLSDHYATLTSFTTEDSKKKKVSVTKRWLTNDSYKAIATLLGGED